MLVGTVRVLYGVYLSLFFVRKNDAVNDEAELWLELANKLIDGGMCYTCFVNF